MSCLRCYCVGCLLFIETFFSPPKSRSNSLPSTPKRNKYIKIRNCRGKTEKPFACFESSEIASIAHFSICGLIVQNFPIKMLERNWFFLYRSALMRSDVATFSICLENRFDLHAERRENSHRWRFADSEDIFQHEAAFCDMFFSSSPCRIDKTEWKIDRKTWRHLLFFYSEGRRESYQPINPLPLHWPFSISTRKFRAASISYIMQTN